MSHSNEPDAIISAGSSQEKRPLDDTDPLGPSKRTYKTNRASSKSNSFDLLDARLKKLERAVADDKRDTNDN